MEPVRGRAARLPARLLEGQPPGAQKVPKTRGPQDARPPRGCLSSPISAGPGCLPSQICSHRFLLGGSATCPGETGSSRDTWDTTDTGVLAVTDDSAETTPSEHWAVRPPNPGAAMAAVSTATALHARPRPGRRRISRGRPRESRLTSGSRRRGLSRGGGEFWPTGECRGREEGGEARGLETEPENPCGEPVVPGATCTSRSVFPQSVVYACPGLRPPPGSSPALELGSGPSVIPPSVFVQKLGRGGAFEGAVSPPGSLASCS